MARKCMSQSTSHSWFPFNATEVEVALGLLALIESLLGFLGASPFMLAWSTIAYLALAYIAGLLVYFRRGPFVFSVNGALQGRGYLPYFRRAQHSLLLLHVDDDPPCEELLGLYRGLLDRGVELRRILFVRPEQAPHAFEWVARFGEHDGLKQRLVPPEQAELVRMSFVVVDERWVLIAVPGGAAVHGEEYSHNLIMRHLLAVDDARVAAGFTAIHEQLWRRAGPLQGC